MSWFNRHKHIWGKWQEIERYDLFKNDFMHLNQNGTFSKSLIGMKIVQERVCTDCGYKELSDEEIII